MKKIYIQTKLMISIAIIVLGNLDFKSQTFNFVITPSIQCASQYSTLVQANITATQAGATSYSWAITPTNSSLTIGVSSNNYSAYISYVSVGISTIICSAYNGSALISSVAHTCVVYPSPTPFSISSFTPNICSGTPITLSTSPQAINNCTWFPTNSVGSAITLTPTSSTCYSAVVTNSYNCSYTTNPYCVNVGNNAPTLSLNVPSTFSLCTGYTWITVIGAANYTWSTSGGGIFGMSSPLTNLCVAHGIGCYTVIGANGCGTSSTQACAIANSPAPTFSVNGPTSICAGATTTLSVNLNTTVPSYYQLNDFYWYAPPAWNNQIANNSSVAITVTANTCYTLLAQNQVCNGTPTVHCISVSPSPTINISGTNTVCQGSSTNFTATGGNTYTWSTNANTSTINVLPSASTVYSVAGTWTNNSCVSNATVSLSVNANCADVWPGDANRDGQVSTADVLELGLASGSTGAARSTTSIAWASQYATAWAGTVSTGWNMAHADCNGDGVINSSDQTAISSNFSLTHSFKVSNESAANPDIQLVPQLSYLIGNSWNIIDIQLGDVTNAQNQIYGVTFDLNYDQSMLQNDSVKIIYTSSFLNANNQNIEFGKNINANGKFYAATVRTDHNDVNGNGKIGELWLKTKSGIAENTAFIFGVSNCQKVSAAGITASLSTSGQSSLNLTNNASGLLNFQRVLNALRFYPNPANNSLVLVNETATLTSYKLIDISGRVILCGDFSANKTIDISTINSGVYFIAFENANGKVVKKLVKE